MTEQTCFNCMETEARCAQQLAEKDRELEQMRWTVDHMDRELQLAIQDREMFEDKFIRAERKLYRERTKEEEPAGKRKQRESDEIKAWLYAWDEIRRLIPGARPVKDKTLGPESSNAKLVRIARRVWSHEDMMACVKGAGLSPWHTAETGRFKVSTLIGGDRRDEKIQAHIDRAEAFDRLVGSGMQEAMARSLIHAGIDREARKVSEQARKRCKVCGRDPVREGCFCGSETVRLAA